VQGRLIDLTAFEIGTTIGSIRLVALRLYGTGVEFYDQSWKPDDVVKVR
jgi:hypothetical protein